MSFTLKFGQPIIEQKLKAAIDELGSPVAGGVAVAGKAQDYAFVLEYGSKSGARPWPKPGKRTARGKEGRIFSTQAPAGYVARFADKFRQMLRDALIKHTHGGIATRREMVDATNEVVSQALNTVRAAAPVGESKNAGQLKGSLRAVKAQ